MLRGKASHTGYERMLGKEVDPYHMFIGIVPHMVYHARRAADEEVYSYRGFHVGASLFAFLPQLRETLLFSAGNTKIENEQKVCAEKKILEQLEGYSTAHGTPAEVIGMVVVGTSDRDLIKGVTGRAAPTLHPCNECQEIMGDSRSVTNETLVVTAGIGSDVHQVHSYGDLRDFYDALRRGEPVSDAHAHDVPNFDQWHTRHVFYDYMIGPYGQQIERRSPAEAARLAISAAFMGPPVKESGMSDAEEAEILKRMARIANPPLR